MRVITNKKTYIIICVVLIIVICLITLFFSMVNIQISPDRKYKATYNRYTKTIKIKRLDTNVNGYLCDGGSCKYYWSNDSKYLIIQYPDGRIDYLNMELSTCSPMPE